METTTRATIISIAVLILFINNEVRSSPSGMYAELHRKPARFKRFLGFDSWSDFTDYVSTNVQRYIPEPVQNFFGMGSAKEAESSTPSGRAEISVTKEQGQWDFFGREWLKHVGRAVDSIGTRLGFTGTTGLDTSRKFPHGYASLDFIREIKAIVPGTHFCGQGDNAGEAKELGYFSDADACCKEHDECEEYILPGEILDGLENTGLFTRSRCDCDEKFYNCLKNVGGVLTAKLGFTFFTVLGPQCFKVEYPATKCIKSSWGRCVRYELDYTREKRTQWFDNPIY